MKPPTTYAEWMQCLDVLHDDTSDSHEDVVQAMEQGEITLTGGVAERFVLRLLETLDHRLKRTANLLQRDLDRSNGRSAEIVHAILAGRRRLAQARRLTALSALPVEVQQKLASLVSEVAETAQSAMEASARQDRTGRALSILRNNAISNLDACDVQLPEEPRADTAARQIKSRRQIILP